MSPAKTSSPASDDPLDRGAVAALMLGNFAHFYSICSLFSYAGIMCVDLGWVENADSAGFVAGFLASANTLGRFPTAGLWGRYSDKHGSRKALLWAYLSVGLGSLAFGLCKNLYAAIAIRTLLLGAGNGWASLFGPLAYQVGGSARQGDVTCLVLACGGVVQLMGPGIAGYTYGLYPGYPALVPSGLGTVFAVAAAVACWLWLPDNRRPATQGEAGSPGPLPARNPTGACSIILTWPLFPALIVRVVTGFVMFALFDVVPLWAISDTSFGGLSMLQGELGSMLSLASMVKLFFTATICPWTLRRAGFRKALLIGSVIWGLFMVLIPLTSSWWGALALLTVTYCSADLVVSAGISLANNVSPAERRGEVNGVIVTIESIAKGLGPMTAANIFAWSIATFGAPGRVVVFAFCASLAFAKAVLLCTMPNSVDSSIEQLGRDEEDRLAEADAGADEERGGKKQQKGRGYVELAEPVDKEDKDKLAEADDDADVERGGRKPKGRGYVELAPATCSAEPVVIGAADDSAAEVVKVVEQEGSVHGVAPSW